MDTIIDNLKKKHQEIVGFKEHTIDFYVSEIENLKK